MEKDPLRWHYTSTAGLLGILASNSLWASYAATLNDSTEIRFGMDLVRSRLPTRLVDAKAWANLAGTGIDAADVPAAIASMLGLVEGFLMNGGLYVFCASLSGDSLSQWRGYGSNSTSGFAVGLRPDPLDYKWPGYVDLTMGDENSGGRPLAMSLHPAWRDVIYDRVEQEAAADRFFTSMASTMALVGMPSGSEADIHRSLENLASLLTWSYGELVSSLKDDAFAEEREVRIALGGPHLPGRANFRTGTYEHSLSLNWRRRIRSRFTSIQMGIPIRPTQHKGWGSFRLKWSGSVLRHNPRWRMTAFNRHSPDTGMTTFALCNRTCHSGRWDLHEACGVSSSQRGYGGHLLIRNPPRRVQPGQAE